jgi:hypothetical protein
MRLFLPLNGNRSAFTLVPNKSGCVPFAFPLSLPLGSGQMVPSYGRKITFVACVQLVTKQKLCPFAVFPGTEWNLLDRNLRRRLEP